MNTCNCQNPPGGTVTCDTNQLAICLVIDGKATSHCISLPASLEELTYFISNVSEGGPSRFMAWLTDQIGLQPDAARIDSKRMRGLEIKNTEEVNDLILDVFLSREIPGEFVLLGKTTSEPAEDAVATIRLPETLVEYLKAGRSGGRYTTLGL